MFPNKKLIEGVMRGYVYDPVASGGEGGKGTVAAQVLSDSRDALAETKGEELPEM